MNNKTYYKGNGRTRFIPNNLGWKRGFIIIRKVKGNPMDKQSECCTCGSKWITGQDGSHSCVDNLQTKIEELEEDLAACDPCQICAIHLKDLEHEKSVSKIFQELLETRDTEINKLVQQRSSLLEAFSKYMNTNESSAFANLGYLVNTCNVIKREIRTYRMEHFNKNKDG